MWETLRGILKDGPQIVTLTDRPQPYQHRFDDRLPELAQSCQKPKVDYTASLTRGAEHRLRGATQVSGSLGVRGLASGGPASRPAFYPNRWSRPASRLPVLGQTRPELCLICICEIRPHRRHVGVR